jgi:hypothetical protein
MLFLHACSYVGFLTLVEQVDSNGLLWNLLLLPFFILLFYYYYYGFYILLCRVAVDMVSERMSLVQVMFFLLIRSHELYHQVTYSG